MFDFSIAIPAHDRGENGPKWMKELLDSLKVQTCQNFNVIVSDQSKNDNIMDVCREYDFEFVYIKYGGTNPCENINTALDNCDGKIIKIMFSDDIFINENALQIILDEYHRTGCKWAFSGFSNWDGNDRHDKKIPKWTKELLQGRNLLSSPTVVSLLNTCKLEFDPELKLLLDVDFYHRMRWKHGMPSIIEDFLVANREHDDRISSQATSQYDMVYQHPTGGWLMNRRELNYVESKYSNFTGRYFDEI